MKIFEPDLTMTWNGLSIVLSKDTFNVFDSRY